MSTRSSVQGGVRLVRFAAVATRFSNTLSVGKISLPSGTRPTPSRATVSGERPVMAAPSNRTSPPRAANSPMMVRIVVVLPIPLRPSSVTSSPRPTARLRSNSTSLRP